MILGPLGVCACFTPALSLRATIGTLSSVDVFYTILTIVACVYACLFFA